MYIDPVISKKDYESSDFMKDYDKIWGIDANKKFFNTEGIISNSAIDDCIKAINTLYESKSAKYVPDEESQELINKFVESCRKELNTKIMLWIYGIIH